jgi:hypothetical protein
MSARQERLAELSARADRERRELAAAVRDLRRDIEQKRARWSSIGFWAGTLVAGATSAYRLFGRNTLSARLTRWSTLGSIVVPIVRFLFRLFR